MKLPANGFKFNCGFDICTYPIQYCDTDDKRCGYCSQDICNSRNIPEQCLPECRGLLTTVSPRINSVNTDITVVYCIASLALLLAISLYVKSLWKCYKHRTKTIPKCGVNYQPVPENMVVVNGDETEEKHEKPTAPQSDTSFRDGTIVANPENRGEFNSHNFGDHNILPTNIELQSADVPIQNNQPGGSVDHTISEPDVPFQNNQPNGPVSHPINERKGEKIDHNILSGNFGVQDTTEHNISRNSLGFNVKTEHTMAAVANSSRNSPGFNVKTPELTTVKEQTSRVC